MTLGCLGSELLRHKIFERCWHRQFLKIFAMFDMQYLQNDKSDKKASKSFQLTHLL